jgi:hypothetical protein
MSVAVVVPWRGGCAHRQRAWEWVQARYVEQHPDWGVIEAPGPEPWSKGAAVNPVVEATYAEIVVVADADVWCDGLERAVYAIACGEANWGMPHRQVHRLSQAGTAAVYAGEAWEGQPVDQRPYVGVWGGGIVVARRETLLETPIDHRFVGWGQEDAAHALALHTLANRGWRGTVDLVHLFHPPQPRMTRARGSAEGWELYRRYCRARNNPAAMATLLEEGRHVDSETGQPALHDRAA